MDDRRWTMDERKQSRDRKGAVKRWTMDDRRWTIDERKQSSDRKGAVTALTVMQQLTEGHNFRFLIFQ